MVVFFIIDIHMGYLLEQCTKGGGASNYCNASCTNDRILSVQVLVNIMVICCNLIII